MSDNETQPKVRFSAVFNFREDDAKARIYILVSTALQSVLVYLTTGYFYTGFLRGYGIDIIDTNILTFIPFAASLFLIFTPSLLTRFPKRKWILASFKFIYYLCIFVGINILPEIVTDPTGRLWGMILLTFVGSVFSVIATAGYSAWHIRYEQEHIRSYFLSLTQIIGATMAGIFSIVSGLLTDSFSADPQAQLTFLIILRYIAFGIGILDCIFLLLPKEVEYPLIHAPRISDIFLIPMRDRKYMLTMVIVFLWTFGTNLSAASLAYYLLDTIGMSYTFYNIIILLYAVIFIPVAPFWRKLIDRTSWFRVFVIGMLIVGPTQIVYGFVQPDNYIVLVLVVRILQHIAGAGHNIAFANFQFINMPVTNRTCYTSFYNVVYQTGSMIGVITGIVFLNLTQNWSFTAFHYTYTSGVPFLMILSGVIDLMIALYIVIFRRHLEPDLTTEHA